MMPWDMGRDIIVALLLVGAISFVFSFLGLLGVQ